MLSAPQAKEWRGSGRSGLYSDTTDEAAANIGSAQ